MGESYTELAVGINLGTTYSRVAVWRRRNSQVEILTNKHNNSKTPSVVGFTDKDVFIGESALNQATTNAKNTIFADRNDKPQFVMRCKLFSAEDIMYMILKDIWNHLRRKEKKAVITVPACFDGSRREAIKNACKKAGLEILEIIDEPVAAAIAYGHENRADLNERRNIFVFDLGGGSLNVALVSCEDNFFKVIATGGSNYVGGEDFNNQMLRHLIKVFNRKNKIDIREYPVALSKLRFACLTAKHELTRHSSTVVQVKSLCKGIDFSESITRAKFEELNEELFKECMKIAKRCLTDAKIDKKNIVHDVVLVGGSTRIPKVRELLEKFLPARNMHTSIREEAAVRGAALLAALLSNSNMNVPNLVLSSRNPLSLGVRLQGNIMSVIIPRNAYIPAKKTVEFFNNGQESIEFEVYEGERLKASRNKFLGKLKLDNLPRVPNGYPVYITFRVDENGTVYVSLEDKKNQRELRVKITKEKRWSSTNEITEMIRQAKIHEAEDAAYVDKAIARNDLSWYVNGMGKALKDNKFNSKLSKENKDKINRAIHKANRVIDDDINKQDKQVFEDCLEDAKRVFKPIKQKIG
ncbi:hypothetical protein PIB30_014839 [Stylosanthes scabra]|uniref:Uncharacterized protein n=1 Tax=Stylosanthes scabra TaxID=79078 RepID=A0ABU6R763_9FABA|nr:hypothetical protein [Stylosanthes scabra]